MRGHYAVLSSNKDIYFDLMYTKAYTISINSQTKKVSEHISYMLIGKEVIAWGHQKLKNTFFNFYFLNKDISLNIFFPGIKFHILIENICLEGVLVTSNVPKRQKKCNQLMFLPNAQCNIEKCSHVGLALGYFLAFISHFSRVSTYIFYTNMLV